MRTTTERQKRVWVAWLEAQWNKPGRLEYYLMQVAAYVAGDSTKRVDDYVIPFKERKRLSRRESAERKRQHADNLMKVSKAMLKFRLAQLGPNALPIKE